jgi:3-methyladenine DNA glycosylase/8-oxoguanine DNA glycosylase
VLHPRQPINSFPLSFRNPTNPTSRERNRITKGNSPFSSVSGFYVWRETMTKRPHQ